MKSIKDFCKEHDACEDGRDWALENCKDLQEAWETAKPEWVVWIATQKGVLTDKELRLFAVFCARQNEHLLTDERSLNAIDVAEKFALGNATQEDLYAAAAAAKAAAADWYTACASADAARAAAWAASSAARAAAKAAAWAASSAARAAAKAAAWAASSAARDAAKAADAAWDAQTEWLRQNTQPNFGE